MEHISSEPYRGEIDLPSLTAFFQHLPEASYHLTDFPYRICAPYMQNGQDARIWRLDDGSIVGFAAWQYCWAMLDYFVRPGPHQRSIERAIFTWAIEHFRALDQKRGNPLPYWIEYREDDQERRALLEEFGFTLDEDYYHVRLRHDLAEPFTEEVVPAGFTIRSLAGEREIAAYVDLHRAAFASDAMTHDWRARTLRTPQYRPELDLVAVTEHGELAGFCIGWLDQAHRVGQVEPLGIHPQYHRRGLGRALLLELLRRFRALQARYVLVEPENNNPPAVQIYQAVGFQPVARLLLKGKKVS